MAIPGSPAFLLPAGDDEIPRRLRDIERSMMELGPSIAASIKPAMDDIRAQQAITAGLVADLATAQGDLATAQGTLAAQQATLTDLISKVVVPASFYAAASNFAVPNAWTTALEHSLTTPAGFTQAVVIANAWARIQNTSGSTASSFGTLAQINGVSGPWDDDRAIPDNNFGNLQATYATLVSGLTGGATIPIRTRVFSSPALSADADNEATINGVVLWLR